MAVNPVLRSANSKLQLICRLRDTAGHFMSSRFKYTARVTTFPAARVTTFSALTFSAAHDHPLRRRFYHWVRKKRRPDWLTLMNQAEIKGHYI